MLRKYFQMSCWPEKGKFTFVIIITCYSASKKILTIQLTGFSPISDNYQQTFTTRRCHNESLIHSFIQEIQSLYRAIYRAHVEITVNSFLHILLIMNSATLQISLEALSILLQLDIDFVAFNLLWMEFQLRRDKCGIKYCK